MRIENGRRSKKFKIKDKKIKMEDNQKNSKRKLRKKIGMEDDQIHETVPSHLILKFKWKTPKNQLL